MRAESMPLAVAAGALRSGALDLLEYIDGLCARIDHHEPELRALLPEESRRDRLLDEAAALLSRYPDPRERPPLFGVPVGVKDMFRVDGFPTRAGSRLPESLFEGPEARSVSLLRASGALVLAKTVTTEFAYFEPGPTRNPYDLGRTPGGSSSGSAAAVAAAFCPLALGTQTVGSITRPAAFCGVVGFKPSFGRVPTDGLVCFSASADHVGLFTQDVAGAKLAASVLCREWKQPDFQKAFAHRGDRSSGSGRESGASRRPHLAVPGGPYLEQASLEGREAFEEQVRFLSDSGYTVKRLAAFPDIAEIARIHTELIAAEMAGVHAEWFDRFRDLYRPRTAELILRGRSVAASVLPAHRASRLLLRRRLMDELKAGGCDLWVSPAAPGEAPPGLESTGDPCMNLPWTHAGLPTVTVPAARSRRGLPLGLQMAAPSMEDEHLLDWAEAAAELLAPRLVSPERGGATKRSIEP